jgi:hypothetical protein
VKLLLILSIILTVFLDFTSYATENVFKNHAVENVSALEHTHNYEHQENSTEESDECEDSCQTHCHSGHNHNALVLHDLSFINLLGKSNLNDYPSVDSREVFDFHAKLIRPPIS